MRLPSSATAVLMRSRAGLRRTRLQAVTHLLDGMQHVAEFVAGCADDGNRPVAFGNLVRGFDRIGQRPDDHAVGDEPGQQQHYGHQHAT